MLTETHPGSYGPDMNNTPLPTQPRTLWNGTMRVRVYEVEAAEVEPEGRALVFETELGKRYAFVFPTDWRALTDDALLGLAERTPD